jgi:hypothetical protein
VRDSRDTAGYVTLGILPGTVTVGILSGRVSKGDVMYVIYYRVMYDICYIL